MEVPFAALVICFPLSCFLSLFYLHSASDNFHPLYILHVQIWIIYGTSVLIVTICLYSYSKHYQSWTLDTSKRIPQLHYQIWALDTSKRIPQLHLLRCMSNTLNALIYIVSYKHFLLAIVLSVLLLYTDSDYTFGIFKHLIGITRIPRKPVFIQSLIDVTDINIWTSLITLVHLHFFVGFVLRIL